MPIVRGRAVEGKGSTGQGGEPMNEAGAALEAAVQAAQPWGDAWDVAGLAVGLALALAWAAWP